MSTPEQWMVDAAKEAYPRGLYFSNESHQKEIKNFAAIIAKHHQSAPAQAAGGDDIAGDLAARAELATIAQSVARNVNALFTGTLSSQTVDKIEDSTFEFLERTFSQPFIESAQSTRVRALEEALREASRRINAAVYRPDERSFTWGIGSALEVIDAALTAAPDVR